MALHTLSDIQTTVLRLAGVDTSDTDMQTVAKDFINHIYADILAKFDWDWMRVESGINLSTTTSSGTIIGSTTAITGTGTSFDSANIGSYIQILDLGKESHMISAVTSTGALTIRENMSASVSGSSYMIFKPDYTLDQQIDPSTIKFIADTGKSLRLEYVPEILLERYFVNEGSIATSDTPRYWTVVGATGGYPIIRFFPIPTQLKYLKFVAMRAITDLSTAADTPIIPLRHQEAIEHGALALFYSWHGRHDLAARWDAQYQQSIKEMIKSETTRATYAFPKEPNDLPKPRLRKFILRLPGAYGGNVLD